LAANNPPIPPPTMMISSRALAMVTPFAESDVTLRNLKRRHVKKANQNG